jgi:hypothetical protein
LADLRDSRCGKVRDTVYTLLRLMPRQDSGLMTASQDNATGKSIT